MDAGPGLVTDMLWLEDRAVVSTSTGNVKIYENGSELTNFSGHAGEVTALALHPCGDILASVGVDKGYIFYDLRSNTIATQVLSDTGKIARIAVILRLAFLTMHSTHYCWLPSGWSSLRCWRSRRSDQGIRCEECNERCQF